MVNAADVEIYRKQIFTLRPGGDMGVCEGPSWSSTRTQIVSKRNGFYLPKEHDIRALKRGQMNKTN